MIINKNRTHTHTPFHICIHDKPYIWPRIYVFVVVSLIYEVSSSMLTHRTKCTALRAYIFIWMWWSSWFLRELEGTCGVFCFVINSRWSFWWERCNNVHSSGSVICVLIHGGISGIAVNEVNELDVRNWWELFIYYCQNIFEVFIHFIHFNFFFFK